MTNDILRLAGMGIIASILITVLKKSEPNLALLLSISACVLIAFFFLRFLNPVIGFCEELQAIGGIEPSLLQPVIKCVGIGFLTQISSSVCREAGQESVGKMVELCGTSLMLYCSLPLFEAVLQMIRLLGEEG